MVELLMYIFNRCSVTSADLIVLVVRHKLAIMSTKRSNCFVDYSVNQFAQINDANLIDGDLNL